MHTGCCDNRTTPLAGQKMGNGLARAVGRTIQVHIQYPLEGPGIEIVPFGYALNTGIADHAIQPPPLRHDLPHHCRDCQIISHIGLDSEVIALAAA